MPGSEGGLQVHFKNHIALSLASAGMFQCPYIQGSCVLILNHLQILSEQAGYKTAQYDVVCVKSGRVGICTFTCLCTRHLEGYTRK